MGELLLNIVPLLLLLGFGFYLRRIQYFDDYVVQKLSKFIGNILIPCVLFGTMLNLQIRREYLLLAGSFFLFLTLLLVISYWVFRLFHIKRTFFVFFSAAFAFGLMAIPLFSTVFGAENMDYLVAMGVGHELFFATVFLTSARILLQGQRFNFKNLLKNLATPLFVMVVIALFLNLSGLREPFLDTIWGQCITTTIQKLGSVCTVLTMIVVGYQIHLKNRALIRESIGYVVYRYVLAFGVGYLMKRLILDRFVGPSVYFDYAYFTMLSQFGSTVLIVMVGEYGSKEDVEVASNAFVLNVLVGIVLYILFVGAVSL